MLGKICILTAFFIFVSISGMLTIRLQRVGKKHEPTYRVVLTDSKNGPKSGKFLEVLGSYDARDKNISKVNAERVKYWMSVGAKASGTVHNFLVTQKIIDAKKINVLPKKTPIIKEAPQTEEVPEQVATPKAEEAPQAESAVAETAVEQAAEETPTQTEAKTEETPAA
jgi:small subunit ribosomal protein S16